MQTQHTQSSKPEITIDLSQLNVQNMTLEELEVAELALLKLVEIVKNEISKKKRSV